MKLYTPKKVYYEQALIHYLLKVAVKDVHVFKDSLRL